MAQLSLGLALVPIDTNALKILSNLTSFFHFEKIVNTHATVIEELRNLSFLFVVGKTELTEYINTATWEVSRAQFYRTSKNEC